MNKSIKYSIIIPTYKHLQDCLIPCCESIIKHTNLKDVEILVVANGCGNDGTKEYIESLGKPFKLIWMEEQGGYVKPVNEGIKASKGKYIIFLNNDTQILEGWEKNSWIKLLVEPFLTDEKMGVTGPMKTLSPAAGQEFILFFCAMTSRKVIDIVGLLEEELFAYGEDTSFCCRAVDAGFKIKQVPQDSNEYYADNRMKGNYPIWHEGNVSFKNWKDGDKLLENNNKFLERYNKSKTGVNIERAKMCDGYMADSELKWLAEQATKSKIIIEIGSWHGKSSRALADNLPEDGRLYCVDHWDGSAVERDTNHVSARLNDGDHAFMEFCDNMVDHIQSGKVVPIRMSSKNAAAWFKKNFGLMSIDLIFIDAGHIYEEIKEDINLWTPLTKIGGVISGHDYNHMDGAWEGVTRAVNSKFNSDISPNNVNNPENTNIWYVNYGKYTSINLVDKPNIYDCFPFFNELDLLEVRFNELNDVVDRFVITEATLTHGGKAKPLYFKDNLKRFEKFLHKVTHIVVSDYPALDSWSIERHQRDALMKGLTDCRDEDIIIIGDADEIPRASKITSYDPTQGIMALLQRLYYYKINCQSTGMFWDWCKMVTYGELKTKSPCQVRYTPFTDRSKLISEAGWHFSYIANIEGIIEKIGASAHQEYNLPEWKDKSKVEQRVREGRDIFDRPLEYAFVEVDDSYPKFMLDNIKTFKDKGLVSEVFQVLEKEEIAHEDFKYS